MTRLIAVAAGLALGWIAHAIHTWLNNPDDDEFRW